MNWLTKLERKYGRICIPNLISILVGAQVLVYAVELFVNQYVSLYLSLSRTALLMGQVWRVITFVFVPFSGGGPLSVILGIYFTWFIGSALEKEWGDFRFNLYLLLGMVGAVAACLLTGYADTCRSRFCWLLRCCIRRCRCSSSSSSPSGSSTSAGLRQRCGRSAFWGPA